jgi:hypothetical protein
MNDDRNIFDVVQALNFEFRHNAAFMVMVHMLDEPTARRVAQAYVEFLYRQLEVEPSEPLSK